MINNYRSFFMKYKKYLDDVGTQEEYNALDEDKKSEKYKIIE